MPTQFSLPLVLALLLGSCAAPEPADTPADRPPNIVLILADDMGYSDLGCFGSEITTPHLDSLGYNGLRMTHFYNNAKCCPTRAALLTGLYPHQAGMGDMVEGRLEADSTFLPAYQGYLNAECVTLAEVLGQRGYHNIISGKWHLGDARPYWPHERGFDEIYSLIHGMSNYFNLDPWRRPDARPILMHNDEPVTPGPDFYMTRAFSDHAVTALQQRPREQPFFLYLAYTAPHFPLHALPEDIARFRATYQVGWDAIRQARFDRMRKLGIVPADYPLPPKYRNGDLTPEWDSLPAAERDKFAQRMAVHAAMIYRMDVGVGRVVAELRRQGELDNTLILFLSDNGATDATFYLVDHLIAPRDGPIGSARSFDSQGPSWANASNTPLDLFKKYTADGGINTSFIAHWPDRIAAGQLSHVPGHVIDIMPTLVAATGSEYPTQYAGRAIQPMEGTSLLPVFAGDTLPQRQLFFEHIGNRAVRAGRWKLVNNRPRRINPTESWHLYDIAVDPGETTDLADRYPEVVAELATAYRAWADRVGVYAPYDSLILAREF